VSELLDYLVSRGLEFTEPRLYVLDGGKALSAAVKKHAGESAAIQRCQVHKHRNVLGHLTDEHKPAVAKKLNAAYALEDYSAIGTSKLPGALQARITLAGRFR
jgi:putative transposase